MKITLYCIGCLKETYWQLACNEYLKRLKPYAQIEVVEFKDLSCPEKASEAEKEVIKDKEGEKILSKLASNDYLIGLDEHGKEYSSSDLSIHLEKAAELAKSHISFVIGGSLGLSSAIKKRANELISFGKLTYPHQLCRVIFLEQLYRCFKISSNEPYHK